MLPSSYHRHHFAQYPFLYQEYITLKSSIIFRHYLRSPGPKKSIPTGVFTTLISVLSQKTQVSLVKYTMPVTEFAIIPFNNEGWEDTPTVGHQAELAQEATTSKFFSQSKSSLRGLSSVSCLDILLLHNPAID